MRDSDGAAPFPTIRTKGDSDHAGPATAISGDFLGTSAVMAAVHARIRAVAPSTATVFLTGETGTGKKTCAQIIHSLSPRARGPFITLDCSAIPPELLDSEVFGHVRGAFPGAIGDRAGALVAADGGTLFLDEICALDPAIQPRLLRFLQTGAVVAVGATRPRKVDVRIICATKRDPLDAVRRGELHEDLYYRLFVVPIEMPPLRTRGNDIVDIARSALARYSAEEGRAFVDIDRDVQALLRALPWPGNVRQLLNVMRSIVVLHDATRVTQEMLPGWLTAPGTAQATPAGIPAQLDDLLAGRTLAEIEQTAIETALARHGGSVPRAARELDVAPSTIYRKREAWSKSQAPK